MEYVPYPHKHLGIFKAGCGMSHNAVQTESPETVTAGSGEGRVIRSQGERFLPTVNFSSDKRMFSVNAWQGPERGKRKCLSSILYMIEIKADSPIRQRSNGFPDFSSERRSISKRHYISKEH